MANQIKITVLRNNKRNPRYITTENFKTLVRTIEKYPSFLEKRPIVIDSWDNPVILAGNMRFKALKKLGYKEIPEAWVTTAEGMSEAEKEAFLLIDNNSLGQWDFEALANDFDLEMLTDLSLFIPNLNMPGEDTDEEPLEVSSSILSDKPKKDQVIVKLTFTKEEFKRFHEKIYDYGDTIETSVLNLLFNETLKP